MRYLAACCAVKNEQTIIGEWMAFHRSAGVEHLILFDNGSTDRTAEIIQSFPDQSSVTYISWPGPGTSVDMYRHALELYRNDFHWIAFIDSDEFLYPVKETDIRQVLCHIGAKAIGVHWYIYGSGGHKERPAGLVIENFKWRAPAGYFHNRHVKSIVQPKYVERVLSSHVFQVPQNSFIDENGKILHLNAPYGFFGEKEPVHNKLRINHYHVRSREDYIAKSKRGYFGVKDYKLGPDRFEKAFQTGDRNDEFDDSAIKYSKLMKFYL